MTKEDDKLRSNMNIWGEGKHVKLLQIVDVCLAILNFINFFHR